MISFHSARGAVLRECRNCGTTVSEEHPERPTWATEQIATNRLTLILT
jgi:hypothetical protein